MSFVERPSLSHWGIEEIEANTCEDTLENRRKLVYAKIPFQFSEPGVLEITFQDYDELNTHHSSMFEQKKDMLTDRTDPWADYLPMDEWPMRYWETAPAWVISHKNKYDDALEEGVRFDKMPLPLTRCKRQRADGSRCWGLSWPVKRAEGFCRGHSKWGAFNAAEQSTMLTQAARTRLGQLSGPALDAMEDLVLNSQVPHVRLKAATEILDRVGIRGGTELNVSGQVEHSVQDPAQAIREKLAQLRERIEPAELNSSEAPPPPLLAESEEIIEGEVVEND